MNSMIQFISDLMYKSTNFILYIYITFYLLHIFFIIIHLFVY